MVFQLCKKDPGKATRAAKAKEEEASVEHQDIIKMYMYKDLIYHSQFYCEIMRLILYVRRHDAVYLEQ